MYHDYKIEKREFTAGDMILLFNSRMNLFMCKLKLRWKGMYRVVTMFPYGAIKIKNKEGLRFEVNRQRAKHNPVRSMR